MKRILALCCVALFTIQSAQAEERGEREREHGDRQSKSARGGQDIPPVNNDLYSRECGSCHFAYQPALLPAASWQKIIGSLNDHFGDNASLSPQDADAIQKYLSDNAAEKANTSRASKIASSISGAAPTRITEVPYIVRKHRELSPRTFKENKDVKSFSNCKACHTRAADGFYDEDGVKIPGMGNWEND